MSTFTDRQRAMLHRHLALAICWQMAIPYQQDANRMATTVIDAIEENASGAMAMRRATEAIVKKLDDEAKAS